MVEIKITGNTPLEALASVTAFGLHCFSDPDVSAAANRILEAVRAKEHKEGAKVSKSDTATPTSGAAAAATELPAAAGKTATPTNPRPPADLPPEPKPKPKPEDQPKPPKLEEVRAKGLEAAKKHGRPAVKAILESFGVSSMTSLAESDRAAFLEKLAELERPGDDNA